MDCSNSLTARPFPHAPSCCAEGESYADNQNQCIACSNGGKCIALCKLLM